MKRKLSVLVIILLSISLLNAVETLGVFQQNEDIELIQICSNCSYNNITAILYPNSSICESNIEMTKEGTVYNDTTSCSSVSGSYIVNGFGDLDGEVTVWSYNYIVTYTGEQVSSSNTIIVIVFLLLAGLFLVLGYSFNQEHWLLKTFFNFCAVGMGILAVNSGMIIASESSKLTTMGTVGLTMMIVVFAIFFLYLFVYYFIETIKSLKEKKGVRWNYD